MPEYEASGLEITPAGFHQEIYSAKTSIDSFLEESEDIIKRYVGPAYRYESIDQRAGESELEPHTYETTALMVPAMVFQNPQVQVKSSQPSVQRVEALMLQHALQRWVDRCGFEEFMEQLATDSLLFPFGAGLVARDRVPGIVGPDGEPVWGPVPKRISPKRFVFDWDALGRDSWRYSGHLETPDRKELMQRAMDWNKLLDDDGEGRFGRWSLEAIEQLASGVDYQKTRILPNQRRGKQRDDVEVWEIWIPNLTQEDWPGPEDGFHGGILTVGRVNKLSDKMEWVREPRPAWVPRLGPYVFTGNHYVPDQSMPLSVIVATSEQAKDLNRHARALSDSQAAYKRVVFVENDQVQTKVAESQHQHVLSTGGMPLDKILQAEFGGASESQYVYKQEARNTLNRASGIWDARRGNATGDATATENAIAEGAGREREGFTVNKFRRNVVKPVLEVAAWMIWHDPEYRSPLGEMPEDALRGFLVDRADGGQEITTHRASYHPETGEPHPQAEEPIAEAWFEGGVFEGQGSFDSLEVTFDLRSMDAPSQSGQLQALSMFPQLVGTLRMLPEIRQKEFMELWGSLVGMPELARLVDFQLSRQLVGVPVEGGGGEEGANRFPGDQMPPSISISQGGRGGRGQSQPSMNSGPAFQEIGGSNGGSGAGSG